MPGAQFVPLSDGSTFIVGWEVDAAPGTGIDLLSATNLGNPIWAQDGTHSLDMVGTPGPGSIFQDLTTTPGASYLLSFYVSSNGPAKTNGLTVGWGNLFGTTSTPALGTWQQIILPVVATGTTTRLRFIGNLVPGQGNLQGSLLDNVSVDPVVANPVPEPATLAIWGLGAAGFGLIYRRRRSNFKR